MTEHKEVIVIGIVEDEIDEILAALAAAASDVCDNVSRRIIAAAVASVDEEDGQKFL